MKKVTAILLLIGLIILCLASCFCIPIEEEPAKETESETETENPERSWIYDIVIQNTKENQIYPLDIGETFYLYIKPYYLDKDFVSSEGDILLSAVSDGDCIKSEFIKICDNGSFLFKVTAIKEGNCQFVAMDHSGRRESGWIYLSIRDYDNMKNIKYRITTVDNLFHYTNCKIYSEVNLDQRMVVSLSRNELRERGYLPCKECCG